MTELRFAEVRIGQSLPGLTLSVTPSVIVAGAMASGDFEVVHHDAAAARARGTPDIFMNILTTNGYVQRFVNDWAAPRGQISGIELRLGVPNYAGDTLRLAGIVTGARAHGAGGVIEVAVTGSNTLGSHVTALVRVVLPA
jgi:3-oxo-4,17-pregnadiene-20-carboxyl-CoA hydratase beta subunit